MGIDFKIREEDDGVAIRRSCIPQIHFNRDRATAAVLSRSRTKVTRKNQADEAQQNLGDNAGSFNEDLVSVLSPVPRGYQEHAIVTPTTASTSSLSISPRVSSPLERHNFPASAQTQQAQNFRSEFSAVVSSGPQKNMRLLLTPPTPADRSARRRLQYEQDLRKQKNQISGISGEIEPPGKWGEAILQPRFRSFLPTPALTDQHSTPRLSSTGHEQHSYARGVLTWPSQSEKQRVESPQNGCANKLPSDQLHQIAHPKFSVPFPLASTPPPPPPPPPLPATATNASVSKRSTQRRTPGKTLMRSKNIDKKHKERNTSRELLYYISSSGSSDSDSTNSSFDVAVLSTETSPSDSSMMENVEVLNGLAMEHIKSGEFENALSVFNHVLKIQEEKYGEIHPAVAGTYHNLGTVHAKRASATVSLAGESEQRHCRAQAVACFQAAARIARDSLGPTHPNVAVSLVRIGLLLLESRQYQNALVTFKEALRLRIHTFGAQHRLVANIYNNMGLCCAQLGRFKEAKQYLGMAISIQREIAKTDGTDQDLLELADTLFNLGGLNLEWTRQEGFNTARALEAEISFSEVLQIRVKILGQDNDMVVQVKTLLDIARSLPRKNVVRDRSKTPLSRTATEVSHPTTDAPPSSNRQKSIEDSSREDTESLRKLPRSLGSARMGDTEKVYRQRTEMSRVKRLSEYQDHKLRDAGSMRKSETERREHLYSLLVSLVEHEPGRREKSS